MSKEPQLSPAEVHEKLEAQEPERKAAEQFKVLADSVAKSRRDADNAAPSEGLVERAVQSVLSTAKAQAEAGHYSCTMTMQPEVNFAATKMIANELINKHGFIVRQEQAGNKWSLAILWA